MSVEVTQADREAAADYLQSTGDGFTAHMRDGTEDDTKIVQAFAAHRHQAEVAMREYIMTAIAMNGWRPSYVEGDVGDPSNWKPGSPYDHGQLDACKRIAAAIRGIDVGAGEG